MYHMQKEKAAERAPRRRPQCIIPMHRQIPACRAAGAAGGARRVAEQRVHEAKELVARDVAGAAAAGVPHRHIPPGRVVHRVAHAKPANVLPCLHRARHQACAQRTPGAPSARACCQPSSPWRGQWHAASPLPTQQLHAMRDKLPASACAPRLHRRASQDRTAADGNNR